jgi:hypothetical protein
MFITRRSMFSGNTNTMDLDITSESYSAWMSGDMLIQHAFPNLTPNEREFLMTGVTPEEWETVITSDEEFEGYSEDIPAF